jgi:hypothetical protein
MHQHQKPLVMAHSIWFNKYANLMSGTEKHSSVKIKLQVFFKVPYSMNFILIYSFITTK